MEMDKSGCVAHGKLCVKLYMNIINILWITFIVFVNYGGLDGGGGYRIRYSIKQIVLIRDSISEISP